MQRQDSEPLFGDDIYNLLREDSLLRRTGSINFASLVDTSENPLPLDPSQLHIHLPDDPQQPQQHPQQQECVQELAYTQTISNQVVLVPDTSGSMLFPMPISQPQEQQQPQAEHQPTQQIHQQLETTDWRKLESIGTEADQSVSLPEGSTSYLPDTPSRTVPSLQPWPGRYSFSVSLPTDNKDRNKWCYSQVQEKLYLCPNVPVPVNVILSEWIDASLTITPVFKDSRFRIETVSRCYNCKSKEASDSVMTEHIVQVEGEDCDYVVSHERYVVSVPLHCPPPGEAASTILMKLMCLTSCVGGPNRRPFCLVFTLRNSTGREIGRQILDTKCCRCPSRDMTNEEKVFGSSVSTTVLTSDDEKQIKIRKLAEGIVVGKKRKRPNNIKVEPGTNPRYVNVPTPVEFVTQVKSYINKLISEQVIRQTQPSVLLYSDDEN